MTADLQEQLSALSDPTRVRLLHALDAEGIGVGELVRILQVPQSTVSRHLGLLLRAGWIQRRAEGPSNLFWLDQDQLSPAAASFWAVVAAELQRDGRYAEDHRRRTAVLAERRGSSKEFFGQLGEGWDDVRQELFGDDFLLASLLTLLPHGLVVADLGCGTGGTVAALAPVARQVIGVDREAAMLQAAYKRTAGLENVQLRLGDLDALPLGDGEVDLAITMLVLHHVPELQPVFAEVRRVLQVGGRWLVVDMVEHDRAEYRITMGHEHLGFSAETLSHVARRAGLGMAQYRLLPPSPTAQGPALFVASLVPG